MSLGINTKSSEEPLVSSRGRYQMPIVKPIFITGLGRSGTTLIHTMLSTHPQVNWLSLLCGKFPGRPYLNRWLMSAIDYGCIHYEWELAGVGLADARLRRQSDGVRTAVRNGVRGASDLAAVAPSIGSILFDK